jgi:nucleotide-binding universal stress UspA family protein
MFASILAPVDLSARGLRALSAVAELATLHRGRVTLLHVIQRIEGIPAAELRTFYTRLEEVARRRLATLARRLRAKGIDVRCEVIVGDPATDIARFAERRRVDVIVVASHRVQPRRSGSGLGTTSYKTAILCRCPILLVK